MSDNELRTLLRGVMDDIDNGRIAIRKPRGRLIRRLVAPSLLAATLGLAACESESVGAGPDAVVTHDSAPSEGLPPLPDAGPDADLDADVDAYCCPVYASPPPIDPE
ncbi:MAG: hypothetical protein ABI333_26280 [bacterium]